MDYGTEEGGELGVSFACAFQGVNGRGGIRVRATGVGQLGTEACFVVCEQCACLLFRVVVGDLRKTAKPVFGGYTGPAVRRLIHSA